MGRKSTHYGKKIRINWEGSLFVHHSLGMVNRELLTELLKFPDLDIRHLPYETDQFKPGRKSKYLPLTRIEKQPHSDADIHVRHRWPPDFCRPSSGKFVLMQPWEYGSLPIEWRDAMVDTVDEIWVYSRFLKVCYERSGIPPEKVKVVPLGIDPDLFNPDAAPLLWVRQACDNRFCFLYNGGVTTRKGTDILINAYLSEFSPDEPVCLVIKDSSIYPKGLAEKVRRLSLRSDTARIVYAAETVAHEELPGLYTAADCYVHPYRAEGYGLPIAEAMACNLPVIVTGGGACLDFVEPDGGYFVKCFLETMRSKRVSELVTVDYPFWLIPDTDHLCSVLRYVFTHRDMARQRGEFAGSGLRTIHTWKTAAAIAQQRLRVLTGAVAAGNHPGQEHLERNSRIDQAISLLQIGSYDEAVALFQKILIQYGENSLAFEGLAIAAFYKKNYDEACNLFAAANRISTDNIDIIVNWYEAAKMNSSTGQLVHPVRRAMTHHCENDELRSIAVDLDIL